MASMPAAAPTGQSLWQRDFILYLFSVILSLSGFWVRFVAQGWLVWKLSDSAWLLGLVGFFTTLPAILVSPLAGVAVDRFSRRRLLLLTQLSFLLLTALQAALDSAQLIQIWQVLLLSFLSGIVSSFDWPTRLALVPNLVRPEQLPRAVGLNSAAWNSARIGGPVLAGLLLPVLETAGTFWVATALFVPVVLLAPLLRLQSGVTARQSGAWLATLRAGFRYVAASALLPFFLLIELVPIIFGQTFPILMPAFVGQVLQGEPATLGWLMAALGVGELVGTLTVALSPRVPRHPTAVLLGVLGFGGTMILFATTRSLWLALVSLALAGLCGAAYSTLNGILVQSAIDDTYRGRVMSIYSLIWGLTPIGSLELGALAQAFGPAVAVSINGLIVAGFALVLLLWPRARLTAATTIG